MIKEKIEDLKEEYLLSNAELDEVISSIRIDQVELTEFEIRIHLYEWLTETYSINGISDTCAEGTNWILSFDNGKEVTVSMYEYIAPKQVEVPEENDNENEEERVGVTYSYNPDAAAEYADTYVYNYNPSYTDYNSIGGGDCTNFVSQCLRHGGLQFTGDWYWYSSGNYSSSWTIPSAQRSYLLNYGAAYTASNSTVKKGNPVYYIWKGSSNWGHAAICVGTNDSGIPVVDAHNNDEFHHLWGMNAAQTGTIQLQGNSDTTPPTISNVRVTDVSTCGYTVTCDATDASGINRVQFPTWTEYNGQDDIQPNWGQAGSKASGKNIGGNTWQFRVNDIDHNFESGAYKTHIYAYDNYGNSRSCETPVTMLNRDFNAIKQVTSNGKTYTLYNDSVIWEQAKEKCEELGGYLAVITSAEEQNIVNQLISSGARDGYLIGGKKNNETGSYEWINGESMSYENWHDGQPDNSFNQEDCIELSREGKWNDLSSTKLYNMGVIMEQDLGKPTLQGDSTGLFTWTDGGSNATSYDFRLYALDKTTIIAEKIGLTTESYQLTDIPEGDYYANVCAVNTEVGKWVTSDLISVHLNSSAVVPVVSNARVIKSDATSFTISCTVTDDSDVDRVQFATWTDKDGQDDLVSNWETNTSIKGTISGNTCTFKVKDSDHNFERGLYYSDIYAFDIHGNRSESNRVVHELQNTDKPVKSIIVGNHEYELYDDILSWNGAKSKAIVKGGHLATITSDAEQDAISNFILNGSRVVYYLGAKDVNGNKQFEWITGEDFLYSNWSDNQPDHGSPGEPYLEIWTDGKWNDVADNDLTFGRGYIVETETEVHEVSGNSAFESAHPYENDTNQQWIYSKTGAASIILTFSNDTELEQDKDYIYIYDENDELVGTYTGTALAEKVITIPGSKARVKLVTDGEGTAYGFRVTKAEAGKQRVALKSISMNTVSMNMKLGEKKKLSVSFNPNDTTDDKTIEWTSNRPSVATVSEGNVTATGYGEAVITAKVGDLMTTCNVSVVSYTLQFDPQNGEPITRKAVGSNQAVGELPIPQKAGCIFGGWYTGKDGSGEKIDENSILTGNLKVYAYWLDENEYTDISKATVSKVGTKVYTGYEICPSITMKYNNDLLYEGIDYSLSYYDNVDRGNATIVIHGEGCYAGATSVSFEITPKNIEKAVISIDDTNELSKAPNITVSDGENELEEDADYSVSSITGNEKVGKAYLTISGTGNYYGDKRASFNVYSENTNLIEDVNFEDDSVISNGYIYSGKSFKPVISVKDNQGNTIPKKYYSISYKNNKNAGIASIIIKGKGKKYKGRKTVQFTIHPMDISKNYDISSISNQSFTSGAICPSVKVVMKGKKKRLSQKNNYTVTYLRNTKVGTNATVRVTGTKNYCGVITSTFQITTTKMEKGFKVKGLKSQRYTGSPIEPKFSIVYKKCTLKEGRDYTVSYSNNIERGKATVTITAKPDSGFTGSITKSFKIK